MNDNSISQRRRIAVIGAGIVGVSCALELQARGFQVTLIDRKAPGQETSYGNAGVLTRSSLIPLNNPGLWAQLPALLRHQYPGFRYSIPWLIRHASWVFDFLASTNAARFAQTAAALNELIVLSIATHRQWIAQTQQMHRLRDNGWLMLHRRDDFIDQSTRSRAIFDQFEINHRIVSANQLNELEPALKPVFAGAIWIQDGFSVDNPGAVVTAYAQHFLALGGLIERAEVIDIQRDSAAGSSPWRWLSHDKQGVCDQLVLATGPWINRLLNCVGSTAPMAFERGYHQHFLPEQGPSLTRPVYDVAAGYVATPMEQGLRLTTGVELNQLDAANGSAQINSQLMLAEAAARQAMSVGTRSKENSWLGARPTLPDSRPMIGAIPNQPGLWLACGHQHIGFCTGPGTAKLLADLITEQVPCINPDPFRTERWLT